MVIEQGGGKGGDIPPRILVILDVKTEKNVKIHFTVSGEMRKVSSVGGKCLLRGGNNYARESKAILLFSLPPPRESSSTPLKSIKTYTYIYYSWFYFVEMFLHQHNLTLTINSMYNRIHRLVANTHFTLPTKA